MMCFSLALFLYLKREKIKYTYSFFLFQIINYNISYLFAHHDNSFRCGLVVRIPGFHPGGPGSIPGTGTNYFIFPLLFVLVSLLYGNHIFL